MSDSKMVLENYKIINSKQISGAVIDYFREDKKELPTFSDYVNICAEVAAEKDMPMPLLGDLKAAWVKWSQRAMQELTLELWRKGIIK